MYLTRNTNINIGRTVSTICVSTTLSFTNIIIEDKGWFTSLANISCWTW